MCITEISASKIYSQLTLLKNLNTLYVIAEKEVKEKAPWELEAEEQEQRRAKLFEEEPFRRKGKLKMYKIMPWAGFIKGLRLSQSYVKWST